MSKKITNSKLQKFNLIMGFLHFAQGLLILVLSRADALFPVNGTFLRANVDVATNSFSLVPATKQLFEVQLPLLIAAFFFMSSIAHLLIATVYNKKYNDDLNKGINKARWIEYSLSASVMMVAISMLVGVYDLPSLFMIFTLTSVMNLLGLVMEIHNQTTKKTNWISFWIGCLAGIIPWLVIVFYFWMADVNAIGGAKTPTFVYWIFVSIAIFFNAFAFNMVLQYKKIGPWKDYKYGELAYIILSLVAKSLLAWQVFAGTLRP